MSRHEHPYPADAARPKNRQARATVGILNTVRLVGTIGYAVLAALFLLGGLIGATTSENGFASIAVGIFGAAFAALFAALFYAVVGWFVDTLSLLTQIAQNTAK